MQSNRATKRFTQNPQCSGSTAIEQLVEVALLLGGPNHIRRAELVLIQPRVVHELAHVVPRRVRKEDADALACANVVLVDESVGTGHRGAAAASDEEALVPD